MPVVAKLTAYLLETRGAIFVTSLASVCVGTALAAARLGHIAWGPFLVVAAAFCLYHLAANVSNDHFDHATGADRDNPDRAAPFTGGSRLIQRGVLTPGEVRGEAWVLFALAGACGLSLVPAAGLWLLPVWGFAFASAYFYSAPPLRASDHGWGELLVGLNLGPLMVLTAYAVQTHDLARSVWLAALPMAFLSAAILYMNEFPDFRSDQSAGKRNLVVRLGTRRARYGYAGLVAAGYASLWLFLRERPVSPRLGWFLLPLGMSAVCAGLVWRYHDQPKRLPWACGLTIGAQVATGALMAWTTLAA